MQSLSERRGYMASFLRISVNPYWQYPYFNTDPEISFVGFLTKCSSKIICTVHRKSYIFAIYPNLTEEYTTSTVT